MSSRPGSVTGDGGFAGHETRDWTSAAKAIPSPPVSLSHSPPLRDAAACSLRAEGEAAGSGRCVGQRPRDRTGRESPVHRASAGGRHVGARGASGPARRVWPRGSETVPTPGFAPRFLKSMPLIRPWAQPGSSHPLLRASDGHGSRTAGSHGGACDGRPAGLDVDLCVRHVCLTCHAVTFSPV